jgi:hypothetical protein
MDEGLIGGEGFAVDASMVKADASKQKVNEARIEPHVPVWDRSDELPDRQENTRLPPHPNRNTANKRKIRQRRIRKLASTRPRRISRIWLQFFNGIGQ